MHTVVLQLRYVNCILMPTVYVYMYVVIVCGYWSFDYNFILDLDNYKDILIINYSLMCN